MNEYDPTVDEDVAADIENADDMYDVDSKEYKRAASGAFDLPTTEDGEKLYAVFGKHDTARWEETILLREMPSFITKKFANAEDGDRCLTIVLPFVVDPTSEQVDEAGEAHASTNVGRYLTERLRFNYDAKKGSGQETMHGMATKKLDSLIRAHDLRDEFAEMNYNAVKFFREYGPEMVGQKYQIVLNQKEQGGEIRDEISRFVAVVEDE